MLSRAKNDPEVASARQWITLLIKGCECVFIHTEVVSTQWKHLLTQKRINKWINYVFRVFPKVCKTCDILNITVVTVETLSVFECRRNQKWKQNLLPKGEA